MGTVSSTRNSTNGDGKRTEGLSELRCQKHENSATHYNEESSELYCLTCFRDLRREKTSILHLDHVHDVNDYLHTEKFKQNETQVADKLKDCQRVNRMHLKQIKKSKETIALSKLEILNRISNAVIKIVKWLHDEEDYICKETEKKIQKINSELNMIEKEIRLRLNQLGSFEEALDKHRREKNDGLRLDTVVKSKSFLENENSVKCDIPDFRIKLILNEHLKLKELLDDKGVTGQLGTVASEMTGELLTITNISEYPDLVKDPNLAVTECRSSTTKENSIPTEILVREANSSSELNTNVDALRGLNEYQDVRNATVGNDRNVKKVQKLTPRRVTYPGKLVSPPFPAIPLHTGRVENLNGQQAHRVKEVKLTEDGNPPNITDSTVLDDGSIVLCDQKNEKLIIVSEAFEVKRERKLTGHPHNLTLVPGTNSKIAVTIPDENVIRIVEVKENEFTEQVEVINLQTKPKCFGIEYVDRYLVYTTRKDLIVVQGGDLSNTKTFSYNFHSPVSLYADRRSNILYVSCLGVKSKGEVVKIDCITENVDFVVSCPEIQHPVCSTVDLDGNVFICNINPPSIHMVTPDGKYLGRVLDSSEGNFQHVNFLRKRNMFLTAENDSNTVVVFELNKIVD